MSLWRDFLTHDGKNAGKWTHYFNAYDRHFGSWRDRSLTFLEIGTAQGGSLELWRGFFGPKAKVVSIDIMPQCRALEEPGAFVRIGDQSDPEFLKSLVEEFGEFDLVLDDGSHHVDHVNKTFQVLYPLIDKNGMYFIEDTHAAYWDSHGGGLDVPESINNISKNLVDVLNADHTRGAVQPTLFTRTTTSITFYDSIIIFQKGGVIDKRPMETGGPKSDEVLIIRTD